MKKLMFGLFILSLSLVAASAYGEGNDENTVLLLHFNGEDGSTNFIDDSFAGGHTITAHGNAQMDTVEYQFGGASGLFDGNGDYLSIPDSEDWHFGTEDFTVDFWVRFNDVSAQRAIKGQTQDGVNFWNVTWTPGPDIVTFYCNNNGQWINVTGNWLPSTNTWYHVAIVRDAEAGSETWHIFIDGIDLTLSVTKNAYATTPFTFFDLAGPLTIAIEDDNSFIHNGWLDEFRLSKGVARWTVDFTPPINEYGFVSNDLPIADAGEDVYAYPGDMVVLDAINSYDPDGEIVNYTWKRLLDSTVLYSGPNVSFETESMGWVEEIIELTVTDDLGATDTDTVSIVDMTLGEIGDLQNQISTLEQQNAQLQQLMDDNRYLLEQLPQLRHELEELQTQVE